MGIFQKSVIQKHLSNLDKELVEKAFQKFRENYNPTKIEKIKELKEEEYQDGFLRDLFVDVFGYTLKPDDNYNLAREFKNQGDGKKADGAILNPDSKAGDKAVAVIELKSTKTKDLKSITEQAFNYKNNQPGCKYVITSNFQKLRFYIDYANEFEEFDLFHLQKTDFDLLYLILNSDSIFSDLPIKLKEETKFHEQDISDKLYKDYSIFKNRLFENLIKNNPEKDKLTLFNKSQKLLDRFLFILFAEDSGLLPPNSISRIIDTYHKLEELYQEKPLYDIFKQYFGFMNTGRKGKTTADDIPAYNGGLFYSDELLDNLKIDDEILIGDLLKLSEYDFNTEVDVNILGHIFEHSLSEVEEITAEIEATATDKTKSKRKKDGVFYTPKYITQYIVENTIGTLCNEKRAALEIEEIEFDGIYRTKDRNLSLKGKKLYQKLNDYKDWLLSLKIVDPACGSGAFLNQALNFLIQEHKNIDDIIAELTNTALRLFDTEKSILENNLFGVDINEESVEIAKLSLWLRTAHKDRKLSNLNNNIKCGNSLIDDPEVAGDKAFDWNVEFKEIMQNGGFDVVIGNPPYLRVQGLRENFEKETEFYDKYYKSATGRFDIYTLFMEKSFELIKTEGTVSLILPHKFLVSDFGEGIRKFFCKNKAVQSILHFGSEMVFADASTYSCIITLSHNNSNVKFKQVNPNDIFNHFEFEIANYNSLSKEKWNLKSEGAEKLFKKLNSQPWTVKDVFENISQGIVSVGDDIFLMKGKIQGDRFFGYSEKIGEDIIIEAETVKPILKGEDVKKYSPLINKYYCLYPHYEKEGKTIPFEENFFKEKFPLAYNYIFPFKDELIEKKIRYKTNPKAWYSLHRSREISLFEQEKIITPEISLGTNMTFDTHNMYHNTKCYTLAKRNDIIEDIRFWLAILNSNLLWFFLSSTGYVLRGGFFTFKTKYLEPFPLPKLEKIEQQNPFIEKVDIALLKKQEFTKINHKFLKYLQSQFTIETFSKKLQNWHDIEFADFIKELNKSIKKSSGEKLSKSNEMEWMEIFETKKAEAQTVKTVIEKTDKEFDQMVYELYGLSEEEIEIVEGA